jgi:hypothetical protein
VSSDVKPSHVNQRYVKEGNGWRLGWDENANTFQGLLAGENWAVELTASEFKEFCQLAQQLARTMETMASELMDEEQIACEAESDLIWLEAEGFPEAYSLRFILQKGRRCEGQWNAQATVDVISAITALTLF